MQKNIDRLNQYDHILGVPLKKILTQYFKQNHNIDYDFFNPYSFMAILSKIIPADTHLQIDIHQNQQHQQNGEQSILMFIKIWKILSDLTKQLKIEIKNKEMPSRTQIGAMIENQDIHKLAVFLNVMVHIMLRNQNVLICVTKMEEREQIKVKEFIEMHEENSHLKEQDYDSSYFHTPFLQNKDSSQHENRDMFDRIQQLQNAVNTKDQLLNKECMKNLELSEQLNEITELLRQKNEEITLLKTRMNAYSEADLLFEEKDQQIHRLQAQLSEMQISSHVKNTQLKTEIEQLKQKVKEDEIEKIQLTMQNEKNKNKLEMLSIQKEEGETANKKVIQNLKQKIKSLSQKVTEQQQTIIDKIMEKEERQKQIRVLEKKLEPFQQNVKSKEEPCGEEILYRSARNSSRLDDQLEEFGLILKAQKESLKKYFDILFGEGEQRCSGDLCIAIRAQYVKIVQMILKINNESQNIEYFSVSNRIEWVQDQLRKLEAMHQQNMKLKQKIVLIQQSHQPNKEYQEQINKLKKKILIMKRKLDETEAQRKQEIQLLVSAFQESIKLEGN